MAYTFFPDSVKEIEAKKLKFPKDNVEEIKRLWSVLNKKFKVKAPINIDEQKASNVNVVRALEGTANLNQIKSEAKIIKLKLRFGNGSLGGRGAKNKGNLFEEQFKVDLENYDEGEQVKSDVERPIKDLYKMYKLSKYKKFIVQLEGGKNTPRPFIYGPYIVVQSAKQKGLDLGTTVTDLTLKDGDKPKVYLSLKFGDTTTFFNSGIRTVLTPQEIKKGKILNKNGKRILDMFGIDEKLFCDTFNGKLKKGVVEDVWPKMKSNQKLALEKLIESGIGFGYHVIHKFKSGKIKSFKVDRAYMQKASRPKSLTIYYGGKTGLGKRINMEIFTPTYKLPLNIRDTQGGDGYPTRMMCDFKYL